MSQLAMSPKTIFLDRLRGLARAATRSGVRYAMLIGVISDTHGLLRPEALEALAGVEHIIHAGDIGSPDIVPRLAEIAPVTAIRGNVDTQAWARELPAWEVVTLAGRTIYVIHDLGGPRARSGGGRVRPGDLGPLASAEDRNGRGCRLPQPRQRRASPVQAADHAGHG